jgi:hypothetical protein
MTRVICAIALVGLLPWAVACDDDSPTNPSQEAITFVAQLSPTLAQQILAAPGTFYFNVHSVVNGAGMVRGQLVRQ